MELTLRRIAGFVLVIVAALSLFVTALAIAQLWRLHQPLTADVIDAARSLTATLDTTSQALQVASDSLQTADKALTTVDGALLDAARSISGTKSTLGMLSSLMSRDLPGTISSAQTALRSAQSSARLLDDVVGALARLPLVNLQYRPDVPLSTALGRVAESVDGLSPTLGALGRDLTSLSGRMGDLSVSLGDIPASSAQLHRNIASGQTLVTRYQEQVSSLRRLSQSVERAAGALISAALALLIFILVWLGIVQAIVLRKGIELLSAPSPKEPAP